MFHLIVTVFVIFLSIFYWTQKRNLNYWKDRGIPGPQPHILYGNTKSFVSKSAVHCLEIGEIYNKYRDNGYPVVGYFAGRTPAILVTDPSMAQEILIRSFTHFYNNEISDMLSFASDKYIARNPFFRKNEDWKNIRKELVPAFSTNRVKTYYPAVRSVAEKLEKHIDSLCKLSKEVDMGELTFRYTTEVVADVIFGVSANALNDGDSIVLDMGQNFIAQFGRVTQFFTWTGLAPLLKKFYKFKIIGDTEGQFFEDLIKQSVEAREKGGSRNDFLQFLVQLKEKRGISYEEMTGHAMTFYLDGSDTAALAIAYIMQRLATSPSVQDKLRAEIEEFVKAHGGEISFDDLEELEYLDAVVHETLRLHPPIALVVKQCTKTFQFDHPGQVKPLEIPVGTPVLIPVAAFHLDPKNFENPTEFIPERFMDGNVKSFGDQGIYLAFGGGPRICLGMKFAIMQIKVGVCEVVQRYRLSQGAESSDPVNFSHFFNYNLKKIRLIMDKI